MDSPILITAEPIHGEKEDVVLVDFHRDMIRIHKENEALRTGSLKLLQEKRAYCVTAGLTGHSNLL